MNSWFFYISIIICAVSLIVRFQNDPSLNLDVPDFPASKQILSEILSYHKSNTNEIQNSPKNKKIAYGYVGDLDVVVNGLDLMNNFKLNSTPKPILHQNLLNNSNFFETFAFFFKEGSAVEYFLENQEDFNEIVKKSLPIAKIKDLGGNGAVMALRGHQEGINVLLGCSLDRKSYEELFDSKVKLVSPVVENMTDIHLVLDFFENEKWGDLHCPRSNRFYLNHDIINTELSLLNEFHEKIKEFMPNIIAIGGLHLFNDFHEDKINQAFQSIRKHLNVDKLHSKIHLEMGSFSNEIIMNSLVQNIFPHVRN